MELHLENITKDPYILPEGSDFETFYKYAKEFTLKNYKSVWDKYLAIDKDTTSPQDWFQELIWVIHASGFSAKAVGKFITKITNAYGDFKSCAGMNEEELLSVASPICNNPPKLLAVQKGSRIILEGFESGDWLSWKKDNFKSAEDFSKFPFVGKVTCYHMARNLGYLESVKPDLHLNRIAKYYNFPSAFDMCASIQDDAPLGLRDLALWYYCSTFGTKHLMGIDEDTSTNR